MKRSEINQYSTPGEELSNEICSFDEIRDIVVTEEAVNMDMEIEYLLF